MFYSSLPLSSKLFKFTALSVALSLAGCGGGGDDGGTDILPPKPDLNNPGTGGNGDSGSNDNDGSDNGEQTPAEDFSLQRLYTVPTNIKLTDEPVTFIVTVKAVENTTGGAAIDKAVSLSVDDTSNTGVTIQGASVQNTDDKGEATYELRLNPLVLNETQKADLLNNGFGLKATASRPSDGSTFTQVLNVGVSKEGSGDGTQTEVSSLNIENSIQTNSVSNNKLNPYGDSATFSVILKNTDGARASDVEVGIGIADIKGIAIVGGNSRTTNENGIATFNIKIDENLTKAQRDTLLNGVVYAINIIEKNGATKEVTGTLEVSLPISDYKLDISGNDNNLNAYGDKQTLTINANAISNKVPTDIENTQVTIKLNNNIKGVSLSKESLFLDAKGQALVDIVIAPTLSTADRSKLAQDGISYTVTLFEPNKAITVANGESQVEIPAAQYQIKAGSVSKPRISSFGSSVDISFRVSDKDGGAVAGETVTARLPSLLTQNGLLGLDSNATQTTDNKGMVSYTVSIPKGLSESNRAILESAGGFVLSAKATESSGASSNIDSKRVQITAESETILSSTSAPNAVNVLKDSFSIQVDAKRPDGSAANDKPVKLTINNVSGVSIEGSEKVTNSAGKATFKVNIQNLTDTQRDNLVKNGIPYTVTLTDDDGITSESDTVSVIMPVAEYQINKGTASKKKLLSTGGETIISFRVNDKNGGVIIGEEVTVSLPQDLANKGLLTLRSAAAQVTNDLGVVSYTVAIPNDLSALDRKTLENNGFKLTASLKEDSGVIIEQVSEAITVSADPTRSNIVVSASTMPSVVNVLKDSFSVSVAAKQPNGNAAINKPIELNISDVKGVSIVGNKKTTDESGNATFIVNIDPSLSLAERRAIAASNIDYQIILTDDESSAIEKFTAQAAIPVAQYQIKLGEITSNKLSSAGGTTTVSFRVNDKSGGVIANQSVTAQLPLTLVEAGVVTLDGNAKQTTNNKGVVSFNVRVPTGLTAEQRRLLEDNTGFPLSVKAIEASGAGSTASTAIGVTDEAQQSQTVLTAQSSPKIVNVLKDSFTVQVSTKRTDGSSAINKVAKLTINTTGISVQDNEQTTDNDGNATFTVNIDPGLTKEQRDTIAKSGISYTAVLTDDDGVTTQSFKSAAFVPDAQYKISFGQISTAQLSSAGGTTTVSFRINDKNGGVIANQPVTAMLPSALVNAGLLTLDGSATQSTNGNGVVTFGVRVPTGLSTSQKTILEATKPFALTATTTETSGASTSATSATIGITDKAQVSNTILRTQVTPKTVNILKDSFTIQVSGKRPDGSAAAYKFAKLMINATGISVENNERATDGSGNATFTVNIDSSLSEAQRKALVASGIDYTVSLTDDDGVSTSKSNVAVEIPAAEYQINFATLSNTQLSSSGGSTTVSFRVNDKNGGVIAGEEVTAELPKKLVGLLILDGQSTQTTNERGEVRYTVRVPAGLSAEQKKTLKDESNFALTASIVEASGVRSEQPSAQIAISSQLQQSNSILKAQTNPEIVNVLKNTFTIQVKANKQNGNVVSNKVIKLMLNTAGLSVRENEARTDASGTASFTVNIDPSLTQVEREAIATSNIAYTAILTDDDGIKEEDFTARAEVPDAQYNINVSPSSSTQLPSSGGSIVVSFRVTDKSGGVIADQNVTASLPKVLTDEGLLTFSGSSSQITNAQGVVNYTINVPNNLTATQKKQLEDSTGFKVKAVLVENSGARTPVESQSITISASSKTTLTSNTEPSVINILKDSFSINVLGKRPDGSVAASKNVRLVIKDIAGLSIEGSQQVTNASGAATFTINIDPSLTVAQRQAIAANGINYTAILTDDDGIKEQDFTANAEAPEAQYQLNFGTVSSTQLSSSGGSTTISFRVNDKNGGVIAGQEVTAVLNKDLIDAGLLTLETAATQTTDSTGIVSYTVRVPDGLSQAQKDRLETIGTFVLNAEVTDDLGRSTQAKSNNILITDEDVISDIVLTATSNPNDVSVYDDRLTISITGQYPDSSAAFGKKVKLSIQNAPGVVIEDSEQTTDNAGRVNFTVNITQPLTNAQKAALLKNGINYVATITDDNNLKKSISNTIIVKEPATSLYFASIVTPTISELGGEGVIKVQLLDNKTNSAAEDQEVSIVLGKKAQDYGVTVNADSNTIDFSGETTFIVTIPEGLSYEEREELKNVGINYQLSYVEKGGKYTSNIGQINIVRPAVDLSVLNNPTLINNRPYYTLNGEGDTVVVGAGISTETTNIPISGQPVTIDFKDRALAKLLTVNGKAGDSITSVTTDASGNVSFTVTVPNNLTKEQKAALKNKTLEAVLRETLTGKTQAIEFNVQSTKAAIDLIDLTPTPLNLNGGETQVEVIAKDSQDNVIAGQKVFLALPAAIAEQGVRLVSGKEQVTNNSGVASYTLAVPAGLTEEQKKAIGSSFFIVFSAADANGNIATQTSTVTTTTPSSATGTTESIAIGANKVVSTKGDTFKVFVRATDNDKAIGNREVRLSVDNPIQTGVSIVGSSTASTNSDGVATFDLKLEPGANVNQAILEAGIKVTATTKTTGGFDIESDYIVPVDTATIDEYQILVSSDKSTLTTGGDQTNATFRVTDSKGGILAGVPVQLAITNLAASGAALTTPSMVTTDANGQIDVGVLLAAGSINARLNHTIDIEAKIVTPEYDANGVVTLTTRESKILSLSAVGTKISIEASNTKLQDGETITITTILVDGAGQTIGNTAMQLVDANGDLITPAAIATTNSDGQATFEVKEDQLTFDSNGNLQVFARAVGENSINTQRSLNSIDLVKVSQAGISFINIEKLYDVNEPQEIQIQIRADNANQANSLIGKQVELQTSLGSLITSYISKFNGEVVVSKPIKPSDIQGNVITVKFWLKSELAGTAVLQATVLGETLQNGEPRYQTTVDTRFRATTPAKMLFQAVKSVITPGTSTEVVATVKDENDVPVEGQTVVFSRVSDSSAGRLSAATAVTDSRGEARVVYQANASSPIGGVIINARLLQDDANIGSKTTNITVSEEAVYTTLAFANKLSSDDIYYTVRGSISVMDGSGRAVADQEVSIKSYATEYAQGVYCLLNSTTTYQAADIDELDEFGNVIQTTTPEPQVFSEKTPVPLRSDWYPTEDANYNYTLDQDSDPILNEDRNLNGTLEAINPVTIIGGTLSDDGYSFVTDDEGRADFEIRYPLRYSNWVKVRFDASTFVNGSENTQSINFQLPVAVDDLSVSGDDLITPWIGNTSPFGDGGARCANSLSVTINENESRTRVTLSPYSPNYNVTINGQSSSNQPNAGFNTYIIDFNQAFELGSTVSVNRNGFGFSKVIKLSDN